jgi:deoxycytidylate deaminase
MRRDKKFATLAFNEAMKSTMNMKHGAIATKNSKVIAYGHNRGDRTKILGQIHSCIHAEIAVAAQIVMIVTKKVTKSKNIAYLLKNYTIWAVRACQIDSTNKIYGIRNSKPCLCCINKLISLGFTKIGYSDDYGNMIVSKLHNMKSYKSSSQRTYGLHYKY